jgi:hypothetical protein
MGVYAEHEKLVRDSCRDNKRTRLEVLDEEDPALAAT